MIDIHCHILPGMDSDGPRDQAEALEMGIIAAADGIRLIVATPHVEANPRRVLSGENLEL